jgi:hypothetical protein
MGDVIVKQTLSLTVAKNPTVSGAAIVEKDFEALNDSYETTAMSEDEAGRINLAASASGIPIGMGTVTLGKMLYVKMDGDVQLVITNSLGDSQLLKFLGGRASVLHLEFTELTATNPSISAAIKGKIVVVGD